MDIASALALDDGRVIIGDAQIDLHAERAAQIVHERRKTLDHARGVLGWHNRKGELGIFGAPILGEGAAGAGDKERGGAGDQ